MKYLAMADAKYHWYQYIFFTLPSRISLFYIKFRTATPLPYHFQSRKYLFTSLILGDKIYSVPDRKMFIENGEFLTRFVLKYIAHAIFEMSAGRSHECRHGLRKKNLRPAPGKYSR